MLNKQGCKGLDKTGSKYGPMASCCENSNKISGSQRGWEFLEQITDYQFLKKDYDPWI
jgi:hypothetical protein